MTFKYTRTAKDKITLGLLRIPLSAKLRFLPPNLHSHELRYKNNDLTTVFYHLTHANNKPN